MYTLSYHIEGDDERLGASKVDVYDLGLLGDKFSKMITISQSEIERILRDHFGVGTGQANRLNINMTDRYRIVHIHPIPCSESLMRHLLLVTEYGLRIYISLDETEDLGGFDVTRQ